MSSTQYEYLQFFKDNLTVGLSRITPETFTSKYLMCVGII